MHYVTLRSLNDKTISSDDLALLLDCTVEHAESLMSGEEVAIGRELAIIRLCANVPDPRLRPILDNLALDGDWREIPGYTKYEASRAGQVRRSRSGHGSMPGIVLKPRAKRYGHMYVNLSSDDGCIRAVGVHVAVCLAFHGPAPSRSLMVCHRNDVKSDNTPENLYWGTADDNAKDRQRNAIVTKSGTPLTQKPGSYGPPTLKEFRIYTKKAMVYRLGKANKNAA